MRAVISVLAATMLASTGGCRCKSACVEPTAPKGGVTTRPAPAVGRGGAGVGRAATEATVVFSEGFEGVPLGAQPTSVRLYTTGRGGAIAAIRRYGIAGNERCLKVTDAAAVEPSHWPGFSFAPNIADGRARLAFDVRVDGAADLRVSWAEGPKAPHGGPEVRIRQGAVRVGKTVLATPPEGRWVHIEMSADVAAAPGRTWTLVVGDPPRRGRTFTDLPLADPRWGRLGEVRFMSVGKTAAVSLLDNLTLTVGPVGGG